MTIIRKTSAHLLADDLVKLVAEEKARADSIQMKHEKELDNIHDHYIKRIYWLSNIVIATFITLIIVALT